MLPSIPKVAPIDFKEFLDSTKETRRFQELQLELADHPNLQAQLALHRSFRNLLELFILDEQELQQQFNQLQAIAARSELLQRQIHEHAHIASDFARQIFEDQARDKLSQLAPRFVASLPS